MAASRKVQVISTKYFMCINWEHYVIYLQNMKFERLILLPGGAYTDAMHFLIHESWLHRLIGKYPKWAKNCGLTPSRNYTPQNSLKQPEHHKTQSIWSTILFVFTITLKIDTFIFLKSVWYGSWQYIFGMRKWVSKISITTWKIVLIAIIIDQDTIT